MGSRECSLTVALNLPSLSSGRPSPPKRENATISSVLDSGTTAGAGPTMGGDGPYRGVRASLPPMSSAMLAE